MGSYKQEYRKIKNKIISTHNPLKGTIYFFKHEHSTVIKKYMLLLSREAFFRKAIEGTFNPQSIIQLGKCGNMPYFHSLEKTLIWYTLGLSFGAEQINLFLTMKSKIEHSFLLGQYSECLDILDKCHEIFGWSMWEIRNRIAVLSEQNGFDGQKQYLNNVLGAVQEGYIKYIANCFSKQCERNVSVNTYLKNTLADYNKLLSSSVQGNLFFCKYIRYEVNGYMLCNTEDINFLDENTINYFLYMSEKCALIDRYISFCNISSDVFLMGNKKLCGFFLPYLIDLRSKIVDPFLNNIVYWQQNQYSCFYAKGNEHICNAFDFYTTGQYLDCIHSISEILIKDISFFPMVELYAKCCTYLSEYVPITEQGTKLDAILRKLKQLFTYSGDILEVQIDLIKILYTHMDSAWARELLFIIDKYNIYLMGDDEVWPNNFYSDISTPDDLFCFPQKHIDAYLESVSSYYRDNLSLQFTIAIRKNNIADIQDLPIDLERKKRYEAVLMLENDPEKARNLLCKLRETVKNNAVLQKIDALQIRTDLKEGKLIDAMNVFVPAFFENSNFIYIGNINQIFQAIKTGKHDTKHSILAPIICSLYFNYYPNRDDKDDIILNMCYEEYLESCGVQRPSEFLLKYPQATTDTIKIRFLAEVCVPNVMDRSLAFDSYDEVLQERIVICETLAKYDSAYQEKYTDEIRRLTNSLLVRLAKREVESSKIYVDVEGIRTLLVKEVCELYERYLDYLLGGLNEPVVQILSVGSAGSEKALCYVVNNFKRSDMLSDIIKRFRDIFVADSKYGLDGCLSVRIRHGTIESQLRSCFERHKLITTKGPDGNYRENTHWRIAYKCDSEANKDANIFFSKFSAQIDGIIAHLKKNLIQVRTEEKNLEGLFDFCVDQEFVDEVGKIIYPNFPFEKFEDIMLHIMIKATEESLESVRNVLQNKINDSFQKALNELETSLRGYDKTAFGASGIRDQIAKARTEISSELKKISEWFRLTQPDNFSDYQLSLAASISYDIMQYSRSGCIFNCDMSGIDENIPLHGQTLPNLVDIFKILLDNVMKHSGFTNKYSVKIFAKREENCVTIMAENPVKSGTLDELKLMEIKKQLDNWEHQGNITREGGTGLHKIKKILSVDLRCPNNMVISLKDNVFSIQISAECGEVLL